MITVESHGTVEVIRMDSDDNRFNDDFVGAFHDALDRVEAREGPVALITTGTGKFFSNGLDLDWMAATNPGDRFLDKVYNLFGRIQNLDAYTVAAVNGHAFAVGAMLASAHDYLVMRSERGYWCVPEVDLGLPLTPEMFTLLAAHLPRATLAEAALTGRRYTAQGARTPGSWRPAVLPIRPAAVLADWRR